jgi:hypothetical protein
MALSIYLSHTYRKYSDPVIFGFNLNVCFNSVHTGNKCKTTWLLMDKYATLTSSIAPRYVCWIFTSNILKHLLFQNDVNTKPEKNIY